MEEYKKAYREGFQDGYAASQRNMLFPPLTTRSAPGNTAMCPVCFMNWSQPMAYVCPVPNCPGKVTCTQTMLVE